MLSTVRSVLYAGFLASYVVRRARRRPRQDKESLDSAVYGEEERQED